MSVIAWPDVIKSTTDVKSIPLDWTAILDWNESRITSHSVAVDIETIAIDDFGGFPAPMGGVVAADLGISGNTQTIQISGGAIDNFSVVFATVGLSDGTNLTRCFKVLVR